jgi:hypothetical protein
MYLLFIFKGDDGPDRVVGFAEFSVSSRTKIFRRNFQAFLQNRANHHSRQRSGHGDYLFDFLHFHAKLLTWLVRYIFQFHMLNKVKSNKQFYEFNWIKIAIYNIKGKTTTKYVFLFLKNI